MMPSTFTHKICLLLFGLLSLSTLSKAQVAIDSFELKVISLNTWGLPIWTPGIKKRKRRKILCPEIRKTNADILCLQETFDYKFRKLFVGCFLEYHREGDYQCRDKFLWPIRKDCSGGLMTFSKLPIKEDQFVQFKEHPKMRWEERRGEKGIKYSKVEMNDEPIVVINLHLHAIQNEAAEEVRVHQIEQMLTFLEEENLWQHPIILLGDLNSVHPTIAKDKGLKKSDALQLLFSNGFQEKESNKQRVDYTYDSTENKYADTFYNKMDYQNKFDYFLVALPENWSIKIKEEKVIYKSPAISDHYGIFAAFTLYKHEE